MGEDVGLQHGDDADQSGKHQAVLEGEAEEVGFAPHQADRTGGYRNGLRRDHLTGDSAAGIGRHHQGAADVDLVGGVGLQIAEERV